MKAALLLVFFAWVHVPLLPASEPLQLLVEVPDSDSGGGRVLVWDRTDKKSHFHVLVTNVSNTPQRILEDSNSWGWDNLRLEFTDAHGKTSAVHRAVRHVWMANAANWWTLAPRETHVIEVYFNDPADWEGFPSISGTEGVFTIRATYGVDASSLLPKERGMGWTGNIVSETVKVRLAAIR